MTFPFSHLVKKTLFQTELLKIYVDITNYSSSKLFSTNEPINESSKCRSRRLIQGEKTEPILVDLLPSRSVDSISRSVVNKPKPLAKPVYHLLKDSQIKSKLLELSLPVVGTREELIKRHSEYVLLHNSEIDSSAPRAPAELRRMLMAQEKKKRLKQ